MTTKTKADLLNENSDQRMVLRSCEHVLDLLEGHEDYAKGGAKRRWYGRLVSPLRARISGVLGG